MRVNLLITVAIIAGFIAAPSYAKNDKTKPLPPGLQKKVSQGKPLPPGWQKKLAKGEILDLDIYQRGVVVVPLDPRGLITIRVEGKLIKVIKKTREIVDILH